MVRRNKVGTTMKHIRPVRAGQAYRACYLARPRTVSVTVQSTAAMASG